MSGGDFSFEGGFGPMNADLGHVCGVLTSLSPYQDLRDIQKKLSSLCSAKYRGEGGHGGRRHRKQRKQGRRNKH